MPQNKSNLEPYFTLAHPILFAGEQFPGGVARVWGNAVEYDDPHHMTAPGQIINALPGGGVERVSTSTQIFIESIIKIF
jgi:hypothetical protein